MLNYSVPTKCSLASLLPGLDKSLFKPAQRCASWLSGSSSPRPSLCQRSLPRLPLFCFYLQSLNIQRYLPSFEKCFNFRNYNCLPLAAVLWNSYSKEPSCTKIMSSWLK